MSALFEAAVQHVESNGLHYVKDVEKEVLLFTFANKQGPIRCQVTIFADRDMAQVQAYAPLAIPETSRNEVCRLAAMVNSRVIIGCLSIDPYDGEVLYRTSICIPGEQADEGLFESLIRIAINGMRQHLPYVQSIVFDNLSAEDVLDPPMDEPGDASSEAAQAEDSEDADAS